MKNKANPQVHLKTRTSDDLISRRRLLMYAASTAVGSGLLAGCGSKSSDACGSEVQTQSAWQDHSPYPKLIEQFIEVEGARLWCTDTGGDGEPIVFLHAHTGSAMNWGYQQSFFAEKGYRVIAYSRRGYYGTELLDPDTMTSMATATADLNSVVEALGLEKFHLVGTAAGGMIAADFAISHQSKLLTLTIACSMVGIKDPQYEQDTRRLLVKEFHALPPEMKELSPSYMLANPKGVAQWKELEQLSKPDPSVFNFSAFRKSANRVTPDTLATVKVPVLIISGDSDTYFPQSRARMVTEMFDNGRYQLIPESGHMSHWEQYELFNKSLLAFIDA